MHLLRSGWVGPLLAVGASGCVSVHSFVEDGHDKADFPELAARDPPTPVHVVCEFKRNGEPHPEVDEAVCKEVRNVLRNTRMLMPAGPAAGATLKVTVDDRTDPERGHMNGLVTGLTEGLVGVSTRDNYNFAYSLLERPQAKPHTGLYSHAMITVAGRTPTPSRGQPHPTGEAFSVIVRQSALQFLADVQSTGEGVMYVRDGAPSPLK
ncbi:MAG: hypothetical protein P4L83_08960 [Nevskia sp.]|nr:hypothetical protein [Nevskia sp.]